MVSTILFKLILISIAYPAVSANECCVTTKNGEIQGAIQDTRNPSKKVCAFTGIPYAAPPLGNLRFMSPQPVAPWNGTLNATKVPSWCPQANKPPQGVNMSEDCLYLNVYRPKDNKSDNLPVMIWIHGGAFTAGNAHEHSHSKLLGRNESIVLVVIQYRLGILGFYSSGNFDSPGNYGLKDQSFAIKWVTENIHSFGGNPRQVTVFGQSAGGSSVMYQLLSPLNKGLLSGAIAQSGSALSMWAIDRTPEQSGKLIAALLGCPIYPTLSMVNCMKKVNWETFVTFQSLYTYKSFKNLTYGTAGVAPVIEPMHPGAFISEDPLDIMKDGNIPNIPVMLGATKHDGSFILAVLYALKFGPELLARNPEYMREEMVPDLLKFTRGQEEDGNRAVSSTIEMTYLPDVDRSDWDESMPGLVDMLTVFAFKASIENTAAILSRRGLPVYLYSFEHHSKNSMQSFRQLGVPVDAGIGHSDDLMYLFDYVPNDKFSNEDKTFENLFCDMWINFGIAGNPTPSSANGTTWATYKENEEFYLKLNSKPTLLQDFRLSWTPNGFEWN